MPTKKQERNSGELSSQDKAEIRKIKKEHKEGKENYSQRIREIEEGYLRGDLSYMQSVRLVILENKKYNTLIRKLIRRIDNYLGV